MPAAITDKFTKASNGSRPVPTTLTALKAMGATSISCGALTGWPTDTAVHFIIYTQDTSGNKVAGSQTDWKGIVSGTTITNLELKAGTDNGYGVGAVVEAGPTAAWADDFADGMLVKHNRDGSFKAGAVDSSDVLADGVITNSKLADAAVNTSEIADGAVTSAKLNPSKTTDANGWTVYDYGTWKEYYKLVSFTGSDVIGNGNTRTQTSTNLPVGLTNLENTFFEANSYINEPFLWTTAQVTPTSTSMTVTTTNLSGSNRTRTYQYTTFHIIK